MGNNKIDNEFDDFDFFAQLESIKHDHLEEALKEAIITSSLNNEVNILNQQNNDLAPLTENEFIKITFEEVISTIQDDIDDELYSMCREEVYEIIENIEDILENVKLNIFNVEQTNELKRYLHTLKGSVKMAGANKIGALAHRLESLLDYFEVKKLSLFSIKILLEKEIEKVKFLFQNPKEDLSEENKIWLDNVEGEHLNSPENKIVNLDVINDKIIKKEEVQYIKVAAKLVDQLINEAGEIRLTRTTLEGMIGGNKKSLIELKSSSQKITKMLKEVELQAESQIQAGKDKILEDGAFDPLEFDRFTRLQELTRFMNETLIDIHDVISEMDGYFKKQENAITQQSLLTNNILDSLMNVRLVRIDSISSRLYNITRKSSKELQKRVNLELVGDRIEVDKLVLDKIISPLEHLLRNCIAHGIELPEERIKKGKEASGNIVFETYLDGSFITMIIKDDGAGINIDKVKEIGIRKNLIKQNVFYNEKEIVELIFQPGFSTSEVVTQISGRGVGMDVVKNEITALGGTITIDSQSNKGTVFTIVLPVSVATNQAMLTENMGKLIAIPALLVNEVISIKQKKLQEAYSNGYIYHRDKKLPLVYMGHLMGLLSSRKNPEIKIYNTLIAVNYLDEVIVVHVDKLKTTNEILIKAVGAYLNKISGLLGVTILGDGRQGTVINPILLNKHYKKRVKNKEHFIVEQTVESKSNTITVMVVDDSITVRRATSKMLERNNYNVILGKDGEDALEQIQLVVPDIILSDIEMPRMDGFEFTKNIRNSKKYAHIPIIMISSRTAEKHINHAFSLGVDAFLGKPYQEEELIEKIKLLLKNDELIIKEGKNENTK